MTVLQNRLEGQCGQEKPCEEGTLQETWREMVCGGGLMAEGEPDSPPSAAEDGTGRPPWVWRSVCQESTSHKEREGVCHKLRSGSEFKGFPKCPGDVCPLCVEMTRLSSEMSGLGSDLGSDLSSPSLPPGS